MHAKTDEHYYRIPKERLYPTYKSSAINPEHVGTWDMIGTKQIPIKAQLTEAIKTPVPKKNVVKRIEPNDSKQMINNWSRYL